jgi:LysM repeat protein
MPDHGRRSPARLMAPLALLLVVGAVALVVLNSNIAGGDDGESATTTEQTSTERTTETQPGRPQRRRYTIKAGDTLGGISEKTGVSVEELQALNPELDPQALVAGQRIKLRE